MYILGLLTYPRHPHVGHKATYFGNGTPKWWGSLTLSQSAPPLIRYWNTVQINIDLTINITYFIIKRFNKLR